MCDLRELRRLDREKVERYVLEYVSKHVISLCYIALVVTLTLILQFLEAVRVMLSW